MVRVTKTFCDAFQYLARVAALGRALRTQSAQCEPTGAGVRQSLHAGRSHRVQ